MSVPSKNSNNPSKPPAPTIYTLYRIKRDSSSSQRRVLSEFECIELYSQLSDGSGRLGLWDTPAKLGEPYKSMWETLGNWEKDWWRILKPSGTISCDKYVRTKIGVDRAVLHERNAKVELRLTTCSEKEFRRMAKEYKWTGRWREPGDLVFVFPDDSRDTAQVRSSSRSGIRVSIRSDEDTCSSDSELAFRERDTSSLVERRNGLSHDTPSSSSPSVTSGTSASTVSTSDLEDTTDDTSATRFALAAPDRGSEPAATPKDTTSPSSTAISTPQDGRSNSSTTTTLADGSKFPTDETTDVELERSLPDSP